MADPVTFILTVASIFVITTASIPAIIAGVKSGLHLVLKAMPEILHEAHEASTKRGLTTLNALFFKIKVKMGEITEDGKNSFSPRAFWARFSFVSCPLFSFSFPDLQQAKKYYAKIEAVALISKNQMMLDSLKDGLALLKTTHVVKDLLDKKPEIEPSNVEIADPQRPVFNALEVGGATMEPGIQTRGFVEDEVSVESSIPLGNPLSLGTDRRLAKFKALESSAIWCLGAVMPPLLFVPKIRHKC